MTNEITKQPNNIFGTVLTDSGPASLYRGETQANRTVLQKLTFPDKEVYTVVSAEAIRNRLREMLIDDIPRKINRSRLKDRKELAVKFKELPNATKFADDLLFGFLMIDTSKGDKETAKQWDSVLRVNYAVSVEPFPRHNNRTMHQSPNIEEPFKNAANSAIIEREVHVTAYQYPFGLNLNDLTKLPNYERTSEADRSEKRAWVAYLLQAIGELSFPAGNSARTMFPFAPVSIVLRLTARRTPDFDIYGFRSGDKPSHSELIESLKEKLLPREEFYIGGRIARDSTELKNMGIERESEGKVTKPKEVGKVNLFKTPKCAIDALINDRGLFPDNAATPLTREE